MTEANEPGSGRDGIASAPINESVPVPVAASAPVSVPEDRADTPLWYPPLPLWKLGLLLAVTLGFYSPVYFYRTAKDVRDHGKPTVTPWLYPLALLIGLAAAIAAGRLAGFAQEIAGPERRFAGADAVLVGIALFVGYVALSVSEFIPGMTIVLVAVALYVLPWLLLQRQMNLIKAGLPASSFRTQPNRYTKLQLATFVPGGLICVIFALAMYDSYVRLSGQELTANQVYTDPRNRFEFTVPRDGWSVIKSNYLSDDADLEMLGPGDSVWAVVYVHERRGWTIDELVESRFYEMRDSTSDYSEIRRLYGEQEIPVSYATYSGWSALDGSVDYHVTTFALEERAVEIIVAAAGPLRDSSGAEAMAMSLRPVAAR